MVNYNFLNSIVNNFKNKYLEMANRFMPEAPKIITVADLEPTQTTPDINAPEDSYLPANSVIGNPDESEMTKENLIASDANKDGYVPSGDDDVSDELAPYFPETNPATTEPTGETSFYINKQMNLRYGMDLRFDLSSFASTVESIADGDTTSVEEFTRANFGFSADMFFKGSSKVDTNFPTEEGSNHLAKRSFDSTSLNLSKYASGSDNFALDSFYKDASRVKSRSLTINNNTHSLTINKFAARFKMDSSFGFSFLNKFNVQSNRVADSAPDSINDYMTSAGNVAEIGTTEMMSAFFDGVDAYLNAAEETLIAKAEQFFDLAAEQLGISEEFVDFAKEQFVGSISSFFDRVDSAIDSIREVHGITITPQIEAIEPVELPVAENKIISEILRELEEEGPKLESPNEVLAAV